MAKYRIIPLFLLLALASCSGIRNNIDFANKLAIEGLWDEAVFRWEKALQSQPDSAALHNNLAIAYEKKGDLNRAEGEYRKAMELAPDNKQIQQNFQKFIGKKEPGPKEKGDEE